ncbi:hypothetical protein [Mycobacterium sp. JS623]|uniref:hypothetical protein n=1 Tax=Mycobacterium sp. JS623 TaxID=212767 RepID=UPI00031C343F|nr:hypothetical protein [Mycobacterium sp. JS623]
MLVVEGSESSAAGFASVAGFVDAMVEPGWCELWRVCRCGGSSEPEAASVFFAAALLSSACDVDSAVVPAFSADSFGPSAFSADSFGPSGFSADSFGPSGFDGFEAGDPAEVEVSPEGDGSSALAIPLLNPTATQADRTKAATVNRNHQ